MVLIFKYVEICFHFDINASFSFDKNCHTLSFNFLKHDIVEHEKGYV